MPELVRAAGIDGVKRLAELTRSFAAETHGSIALVGATLIDGTDRPPIANAVVVLDGDKIVAVGPRDKIAIPSDATTIDATGKFLVPGLWDMHAHLAPVEQVAAYLAAGVTSIRDIGYIIDFIAGIRDAIEAGKGIGPRILFNGLVDGNGPNAIGSVRIGSREDIPKVIDKLRAAGCQEVKIYQSISPALVPAIIQYAHAHGMRVVGHVPDGMLAPQAIEAGYDSISHVGFLLQAFGETPKGLSRVQRYERFASFDLSKPELTREIDALLAHHVMIDPTLVVTESVNVTPATFAKLEPGVATMPPEMPALSEAMPADFEAKAKLTIDKLVELVGLLHKRLVTIVAGTDVTVPGHSLHRELELYVQAGFTPLEALQAATIVPARYMHRDHELGTIEPGKRADLVVLAGDPLADIHNIRKVERVIARGKIYDARALWQLVGFKPL